MPFKMKYKNLSEVVKQLRSAVVAHGKQADIIEEHINDMEEKSPLEKKKGPCWEGYEMIGMKKKNGRNVPNCVPIKKK
tara:strand:- start:439 stop:672 length:234 start_codon:yes stop_codon:yes gene_type:complete